MRSPAKINLSFRVLFKRADQYHEIDSIYQAIDLFDQISISKASSFSLSCSNPDIPCDHTNLISKAHRFFCNKLGFDIPVKIDCQKCIPIGAGLGGGSSNAATTLFGLNRMCDEPFSCLELQNMAGEIGSDVPFFFSLGTAHVTGRGEVVENICAPDFKELWLLSPPIHCSTPKVYQNYKPQLHVSRNDLQEAAFAVYPELLEYYEIALNYFKDVWLTGTGSTFVCKQPLKIGVEKMPFTQAQLIQRKNNEWW